MDIPNPRRILAVALAESQDHLSRVIKDLTGDYPTPSPATGVLAGTTHDLVLKTPYYAATVPIWLDLVGQVEPKEEGDEEGKTDGKSPKEGSEAAKGRDSPSATAASTKDGKDTVDTPKPSPPQGGGNNYGSGENDTPMTPKQWADAFLADEAKEVRAVLGGVVVVVDISDSSSGSRRGKTPQHDLLHHVGRLVREGLGTRITGGDANEEEDDDDVEEVDDFLDAWDGVGVVVGVAAAGAGPPPPEDVLEAWDDACVAAGLEFVLVAPGQPDVNEFGEKTGIPRVLEALEANDWAGDDQLGLGGDDDGDIDKDAADFGDFQGATGGARRRHALLGGDNDDDNDDDLFDPESLDFGFDRADFAGLRQAIWAQQTDETGGEDSAGGGASKKGQSREERQEEDDVEAMDRMMRKLLAARDLGAGLPPEQRRRLAARAVGEVMKEL